MTPLRKRMMEELQLRNLSPVTADTYLRVVERFARHFDQSPDRLGLEQVREYLLHLLREKKVVASTLMVNRAALRFLYAAVLKQKWFDDVIACPKRRSSLPGILSPDEITRILDHTHNLKHWTIIATLYATGLRANELRHLKVSDIDGKRMVVHVREGKSGVPRDIALSPVVRERLRVYFRWRRPTNWLFPSKQKLIYSILFRSVSETLLGIARDPRLLGAQLGFLTVLHTWSQKMLHHPHLHCLVPAGGLAPDRSKLIPCRKRFFLPAELLRRKFRGKFLALLATAFRHKKLRLLGQLQSLKRPEAFDRFLCELRRPRWVVEVRPPFGGPEHVLKYLARYTHRVAISNGRLIELRDGQVTFRWRDSADHNKQKRMTLDAIEFMRRFATCPATRLRQDSPLRLPGKLQQMFRSPTL